VSRKGKASPLEAGRGKYSPPASPERVTSEALKRRDRGVLRRNMLPGNEISFLIVPLDPAYKAGLAGHLPAMAGRTDG